MSDEGLRPVRWYHLVVPVVAMFAGPIAAGLLFGIAYGAMHPGDPDVARNLTELMTQPAARFVLVQCILASMYIAFLLALTLMLGRVGSHRMVADFTRARGSHLISGLVVGFLLAAGSMALLGWLASQGIEFQPNKGEEEVMPRNLPELLMAGSTVVILGPFAEELYFRGALMSWLRDRMGLALAILVSAVLFGLVHFNFLVFPGIQGWILTAVIAAIGVVNGLWAARSGSLWPAFATHAGFNGTMVAAAMLLPGASP